MLVSNESQANRELEFIAPLGIDLLLIRHFKGEERLGRLFKYEVTLRSKTENIEFESLLGVNASVRLDTTGSNERYFNGFITDFSQGKNEDGFATYFATLSPWLWFLKRTNDCRIFQEQTVVNIIESVLAENEYTDFEFRLNTPYRQREYTVQYRESDFNFISRLMEEEGIYYFFEHHFDYHKIIFSDSYESHEKTSAYEKGITFDPASFNKVSGEDAVSSWKHKRSIKSGSVVLDDYDFKKPRAFIRNDFAWPETHLNAKEEVYDYPGKYTTFDEGKHYARIRQEEMHAEYAVIKGKSDAREFSTGRLMTLVNHPREDQNIEYLITNIKFEVDQDAFGSSKKGGSRFIYKNKFKVIKARTPFRSKRKSKASIVEGPQSAKVVGPSGEEIYCDEFGRVKVQFPWDRYGEADENSSCWIRVSQNWAGRKWGAINIPRIGQEVIVDFLEGDPDRPIITGKVYNADLMPPYELPSNKNISGIKTRSSKGGGGFNEITMDDTAGEEQVFIHAEKQHDQRTKEDHLTWVGKNQHHIVEGSSYDKVHGDKHHSIKGELNYFAEDVISIETKEDIYQKATKSFAHESGDEIHLKAGTKVVIESGTQISLKVGGSFIDIGPAGISIKGPMVNINSGGSPASGIGSDPETAKLPKEADNREPPDDCKQEAAVISKDSEPTPTASVLKQASRDGTPFCEECEKARKANEADEIEMIETDSEENEITDDEVEIVDMKESDIDYIHSDGYPVMKSQADEVEIVDMKESDINYVDRDGYSVMKPSKDDK